MRFAQTQESLEKSEEMRRLYEQENWSIARLAAHFRMTRPAVWQRLKKIDGLRLRSPGCPRREIDRNILIKVYVEGDLTFEETFRRLKTDPTRLKRELTRCDLPTNFSERWHYRHSEFAGLLPGQSRAFELPDNSNPYRFFYEHARRLGFKVSIRRIDARSARVTRIG